MDKKSNPNESKAASAVLVSRVFGVKGLADIIMGFGDLRDNARFAQMTSAAREASTLLMTPAYIDQLLERCKAVQLIDLYKFSAKPNAKIEKTHAALDRDDDWHWDICKHCEVKTMHRARLASHNCATDIDRHVGCRALGIRYISVCRARLDAKAHQSYRSRQYSLWLLNDIWRSCFDADWENVDVPDWFSS